jgi:hypothetical protein
MLPVLQVKGTSALGNLPELLKDQLCSFHCSPPP